jgi:hypothetical protein
VIDNLATLPSDKRVVGEEGIDPADRRRTLYRLSCGHVVSRRTDGFRKRAKCGLCNPLVESDVTVTSVAHPEVTITLYRRS